MFKAIRTDSDYEAALARIDALMDARPGTPQADELDVLADLVEHYESKHEPLGYPSPAEAIRFRMDQAGLTPRDLVSVLGSRAKVSEVLSGKRQLSMRMARALHDSLGIPAAVLLRPADPPADLDWQRFPWKAMVKRGWIHKPRRLDPHWLRDALRDLMRRAGCEADCAPLLRRAPGARANAKADPYALQAWCWRVMELANGTKLPVAYEPGTIDADLLRRLAELSAYADGPRRARQVLVEHGIHLVVEPHLPRTYLDGAALKLPHGAPVVALTLRDDRLDNFWFTLLHELAHVGRHLDAGADGPFLDDLSLRDVPAAKRDRRELEADEWAEEALIPAETWQKSQAGWHPTVLNVVALAHGLGISPAIVAGRIRHERKNYRLLSHLVGAGQVRSQFA